MLCAQTRALLGWFHNRNVFMITKLSVIASTFVMVSDADLRILLLLAQLVLQLQLQLQSVRRSQHLIATRTRKA
ncbi:unannotated protein [freshwater metagenome]|uniref:Unannotated protein n=1 Tax=freshwater metagenome TaxID=449393 RepID=A0A6J6NSA5_9ZZZZ